MLQESNVLYKWRLNCQALIGALPCALLCEEKLKPLLTSFKCVSQKTWEALLCFQISPDCCFSEPVVSKLAQCTFVLLVLSTHDYQTTVLHTWCSRVHASLCCMSCCLNVTRPLETRKQQHLFTFLNTTRWKQKGSSTQDRWKVVTMLLGLMMKVYF